MTATIVHTSSREQIARVSMARVAAGSRIQAARIAREHREAARRVEATTAAVAWVEDLRAAGADRVGFKICTDEGKFRLRATLADAVGILVNHWGEDVEAWGLDSTGEFVGEGW
jgi:hypothetical protein